MNFGRIIQQDCVNVPPPIDSRCSDPAFALQNPEMCGVQSVLILKPSAAISCTMGSVQFKAFSVQNGVETELTEGVVFSSGDLNVAVIGAASGSCTGIAAGETTITATYQGKSATAQMSVLSGDTCCDQQHVAMLLMVDTTKSMSQQFGGSYGTRLDFAKAAAVRVANELNTAKDVLGVMEFHDTVSNVLEYPTNNVASLLTAINGIAGTALKTEFWDAVQAAILTLNSTTADRRVLIIISDGDDTLTPTFDSTNDPLLPLQGFKDQGGIVMCLGARASGDGFAMLSAMSTGGFFLNAYPDNAADSLNYLSGLKGYVCAGNCTPAGDVIDYQASLNFDSFTNWTVQDGTLDLIGNGFMDLIPGNGLYVDLLGSTVPQTGRLQSRTPFNLVAGHSYRLKFSLAGNQRKDLGVESCKVRVIPAGGGVDIANQTIAVTDYKQGFQQYSVNFNAINDLAVLLSFNQVEWPLGGRAIGLLLDNIVFEDTTSGTILLSDNFDTENPVYVPPGCGHGTVWTWLPNLNAYGYASGYLGCYGTGCLSTPPAAQSPDPDPLPDIESGGAPPPHTYTSTKTVCVSCPNGTTNVGTAVIAALTANSAAVSASSEADNGSGVQEAWLAFDQLNGTYWASQGAVPQWLQYDLGSPQTATSYSITPLFVGKPTAWTLYGSTDGVNFTEIDARVDSTGTMLLPTIENVFPITSPGAYRYYRLTVTAVNSKITYPDDPAGGISRVAIPEFQLFAAPTTQACGTATATSTASQAAADASATAAATATANANLNCRTVYTSTQQFTAHCPLGSYGQDITRSATVNSFVSQTDADAQALALAQTEALAALDCTQSNNTQNIVINDRSGAFPQASSPYPSVKYVHGLTGHITKVTVNVNGIAHTSPSDVFMVLRSPAGTYITLMQRCGGPLGASPISNVDLVFDDLGASLPQNSPISSGTYAPTHYGGNIDLPAPANAGPYQNALAQLFGEDPNGSWSLWVCDINVGDAGSIANGWDLTITTA